MSVSDDEVVLVPLLGAEIVVFAYNELLGSADGVTLPLRAELVVFANGLVLGLIDKVKLLRAVVRLSAVDAVAVTFALNGAVGSSDDVVLFKNDESVGLNADAVM